MQGWEIIAGSIITAATMLAGALKLLAGALARELRRATEEAKAWRAATVENTQAAREGAQTQRELAGALRAALKRASLCALPLILLAGCASAPAQVHRDMSFARQAWREDRRPDLEPDVVQARELFFRVAIETAAKAAGAEPAAK